MPDLKKAEFGCTGTVAGRDVASSDCATGEIGFSRASGICGTIV